MVFNDYFGNLEHSKKEKNKSRELRQSQWWKNKRACNRCHYCQEVVPATQLTMDHIVPISKGGKTTKSNVVPACKKCNTAKKDSYAFEFKHDKSGEK